MRRLAKHPRVQLHFTPTSGSWLNMVEIFFGITKQAIRRGTFNSVRELKHAIRTYTDSWNQRCHPFIWIKDADTSWPQRNVQLHRYATLDGTGHGEGLRGLVGVDQVQG